MDPRYFISLSDPGLGKELVKDPKGPLPINVWCRYCGEYAGADYESLPVFQWIVDRSWPKPIPPKQAVDMAVPLAYDTIQHLKSGSNEKALASAKRAWEILFTGSSDWRPGRGQPASMRLTAVRAFTIRKFNPHWKKANDSSVSFRRLADMLFLKDGKCPRKIREGRETGICGVSKHSSGDPCVEALTEAVNRLKDAMKHDGIPI